MYFSYLQMGREDGLDDKLMASLWPPLSLLRKGYTSR